MNLPSFLEYEDEKMDFIRLTGHRVGLAHVVREYNRGSSAEMIAVRFPSLKLSHIYSVLAFYLDNKAEVDAYVAADDAELARQEAEWRRTRTTPTLEELRRRFDAMRNSAS
jgi:uncharacterized protein (DUF433 family)